MLWLLPHNREKKIDLFNLNLKSAYLSCVMSCRLCTRSYRHTADGLGQDKQQNLQRETRGNKRKHQRLRVIRSCFENLIISNAHVHNFIKISDFCCNNVKAWNSICIQQATPKISDWLFVL